jgi:hypothetical protein
MTLQAVAKHIVLEEENARLAEHDRQLQQDRDHLEEAVAMRTAKLQSANASLVRGAFVPEASITTTQ